MMGFIKTFLIGLAIGISNVIPGFSGGTMAVVLNIYDKFVDAITLNIKKLIANRKFVVPLLLGMLCGVLFFSEVVKYLFSHFPWQTDYVFTGIIFGSIPMLYMYIIKPNKPEEKKRVIPSVSAIVSVVIGLAVMLGFTYLQKKLGIEAGVVKELPKLTLVLGLRLFIAGLLGAIAMIIPGISGSFIMLILGIYPIVIAGVASIVIPKTFLASLVILLPNGVGVLIGLVCGAKLVSFLIKRFPRETYGVIFGLVLGSIPIMFPGFEVLDSFVHILVGVLCFAAGFALAFFGSKSTEETKTEN